MLQRPKAYSPGIKLPNRFASAKTHNLASHFILSRITKVGESLWWKTLVFLSFQISYTSSITREAKPFWCGLSPSAIEDHQSWMLAPIHCPGWIPWRPNHSCRSSQTLTVKRQWMKRWLLVSSVCLQRGQRPQLSQPRLHNRSAVESLFCNASHAWFLTFGGAHTFQISLFMEDSTRPRNWNLYVDAVEYWPFVVCFQEISSSTSSRRCTLWIRA
jgi:hypothetical protein